MAKKGNGYKFGLSKLIIAKRTVDAGTGTVSYSDAFQCGEAMKATITPNYVTGELYGDNRKVADISEFVDASVVLGSTTMPYQATQILFGHDVNSTTGVERSAAGDVANEVGLGFTSKNHDGTYDACVIYRSRFTEGAEDFNTKGSSISFVTPELSGKALGREEDGEWRVKNYAFASESLAVDWICSVLDITNTFTVTKFNVTQTLTHATSSFTANKINKNAELVATLTADTGYTLATPTVTMGGTAVTGAWDSTTSKVTISSVTGDVVITETATQDE